MEYIKLENITKKIKGNIVLDKINIEFEKGKIYGIQGHNGCGKTMLLRAIAGLIVPTTGNVIIDGKIIHKDIDFPPKVGVLIENPMFWKNYTLKATLKTLASIKNEIGDSEIENAIERVGLKGKEQTLIRKFSLGMRQRLGIAQAIMEKPDLLLLDEPTNALDTDGNQRLEQILKEEKSNGTTVIVVSHSLEWLTDLCDETITMENGKILKEQTKYTKKGDDLSA